MFSQTFSDLLIWVFYWLTVGRETKTKKNSKNCRRSTHEIKMQNDATMIQIMQQCSKEHHLHFEDEKLSTLNLSTFRVRRPLPLPLVCQLVRPLDRRFYSQWAPQINRHKLPGPLWMGLGEPSPALGCWDNPREWVSSCHPPSVLPRGRTTFLRAWWMNICASVFPCYSLCNGKQFYLKPQTCQPVQRLGLVPMGIGV